MREHFIRIEIQDGAVKEILDRMTKAQETIFECYQELENIGVVTISKEKDASVN